METHYINTDLDLISERPFDELSIAALGASLRLTLYPETPPGHKKKKAA